MQPVNQTVVRNVYSACSSPYLFFSRINYFRIILHFTAYLKSLVHLPYLYVHKSDITFFKGKIGTNDNLAKLYELIGSICVVFNELYIQICILNCILCTVYILFQIILTYNNC